jgi:error-prone DNA polymerase
MIETQRTGERFCNVCSHEWIQSPIFNRQSNRQSSIVNAIANRQSPIANRFSTLDNFIRRTGIRRDEVATLASIGALNAFGYDRRTALWQIEQAVRPAGALFADARAVNAECSMLNAESSMPDADEHSPFSIPHSAFSIDEARAERSPLAPMTTPERLLADYAGTSLTIGPHPMSLRRPELALRGVLRASDLPNGRHGRRVRVAGAVITRQRPGTAKGFVFLTLEDETGIANIIVRPDLFDDQRAAVIGSPYVIVDGTLQIQEGVTSVKAERVQPLTGGSPPVDAHDFY